MKQAMEKARSFVEQPAKLLIRTTDVSTVAGNFDQISCIMTIGTTEFFAVGYGTIAGRMSAFSCISCFSHDGCLR
jgi:hypothetical protein